MTKAEARRKYWENITPEERRARMLAARSARKRSTRLDDVAAELGIARSVARHLTLERAVEILKMDTAGRIEAIRLEGRKRRKARAPKPARAPRVERPEDPGQVERMMLLVSKRRGA